MFSAFDDYLVHLKLAEAREMWHRAEWLQRELGKDSEARAERGWKVTLQLVVDELIRGGFGRGKSAADAGLERSAWGTRGE